jgi:lipopolysaccharide export system permease protein
MNTVFRYLFWQIVKMVSLVLAIISVLELFILFTTESGNMGDGGYGLHAMIVYVFMSWPNQVYQLMPMIMLLGGTLALGNLAVHNELVVLRTAGISIKKLSMYVFSVACIIAAVTFTIGEGIAAPMVSYANSYKNAMINIYKVGAGKNSLWFKNNNQIIHITSVTPDKLYGVRVYDFNAANLAISQVYVAASADVYADYWRLHAVTYNKFSPKAVQMYHVKNAVLPIKANPVEILRSIDGRGVVKMGHGVGQSDSLRGLYRVIDERVKLGLVSTDFYFAAWQRLLQPVMSIFMLLQAVPIIFKSFGRMVLGKTIFISLFISFFIYILNQFIGPMCLILKFPALIAALIPVALIILCYVGLMWRVVRDN